MFDFLKRLKKTEEIRTLSFTEIATLLADGKAGAQETMRAGVLVHRAAILQGQHAIRLSCPPSPLPASFPRATPSSVPSLSIPSPSL